MKLKYLLLILGLTAFSIPKDDFLDVLRKQWSLYEEVQPRERIYLSLSEKVVAAGDTIWFGGYLHHEGKESRVLYVELVDNSQSIQKEIYDIKQGFGAGQVAIPDSLSSGIYQLRAYTQWMRNGSPLAFFTCPVLVVNPYDEDPPVPGFQRELNTKLRVTPEGGDWVANQLSRVLVSLGGDENRSLSGHIVRLADTAQVASIQLAAGMDLITMRPLIDTTYQAQVYLPSGDTLKVSLPEASVQGVSLQANIQGGTLQVAAQNSLETEAYLLVRTVDTLLHSSKLSQQVEIELFINNRVDNLIEVAVIDSEANVLAERLISYSPERISPDIVLEESQYTPRQPVKASFKLPNKINSARVSVSVRKLQPSTNQLLPRAVGANVVGVRTTKELEQMNLWLIDHRSPFILWKEILASKPTQPTLAKEDEYFLITGSLSISDEPVPGQLTLLSVPGFNPHFDYDRTDSAGNFNLPVYDVYGQKEVVFLLDDDTTVAEWVIADKFAPLQRAAISSSKPLFEKDTWSELLSNYRQRAQILTQYDLFYLQSGEQDIPRKSRFYGEPNFEIKLDDYISLPDFVEVARELMPGIRLRKKGEDYVFSVFDVRTRTFLENPPALLLDGVLVNNPNDIVALSPTEIDKIETVNRRTYYGEYRFDGMIAVYTKKGEAFAKVLPANAERKKLTFFTPMHPFQAAKSLSSYQPDLRTLLHWQPSVKLEGGEVHNIEFSNADELGEFEIVVKGFTDENVLVTAKRVYSVTLEQTP